MSDAIVFQPKLSPMRFGLDYRFPLSFRDVEDLSAERGISVSFQTVAEWVAKFSLKFTHQLRRRSRGGFADKWQLDEMVVTIKGKKYWLWRAVDANGYVLDALLQSRRNKALALRLTASNGSFRGQYIQVSRNREILM